MYRLNHANLSAEVFYLFARPKRFKYAAIRISSLVNFFCRFNISDNFASYLSHVASDFSFSVQCRFLLLTRYLFLLVTNLVYSFWMAGDLKWILHTNSWVIGLHSSCSFSLEKPIHTFSLGGWCLCSGHSLLTVIYIRATTELNGLRRCMKCKVVKLHLYIIYTTRF